MNTTRHIMLFVFFDSLKLEHSEEKMSREELLKYFCDLTLDPNTVHNRLSVVEGNKKLCTSPPCRRSVSYEDQLKPLSLACDVNHSADVICAALLTSRVFFLLQLP
ncbi:hypothetical protein QQF64_018863 [Cirrhinus molitorella]|uniref:Uncharacterized protein n=1 Tax=Cirrhinus molitorella TaxID=172907 RepID=A0ABR3LHB4_9TELE